MEMPRIPEPGKPLYREALDKLTPEMRETFVDACVVAGLSEDDVAHALILAQARILDAGFTAHTRDVAGAVRQELAGLSQKLDQVQKDGVEADKKQAAAFRSNLDENQRAYAKLHGERATVRQQILTACGITAVVASVLTVVAMNRFVVGPERQKADERVDAVQAAAGERYWTLVKSMPEVYRLAADLKRLGGFVRYVEPDGKPVSAIVIHWGGIRVGEPSFDEQTREASFPLIPPSPPPKAAKNPNPIVKRE